MSLRDSIRRHRKDNRFLLAALGVMLAVFTGIFYLIQRGRDLPPALVTDRVLLFVLWYLDVVLILAIGFVLARNLFKLLVERQNRILGSKFKIKLVATYIGLSLIPVLLLFAYATEMLQGSINRWFDTPVRQILERGYAVSRAMNEELEATTLRDAFLALHRIEGADLSDPAQRPALARLILDTLEDLELDYLAVYEDTAFVHGVVNPQAGLTDLPEPGRAFLTLAIREGQALRRLTPPTVPGHLILTAVAGIAEEGPRPVVVAGRHLEPRLAGHTEQLAVAYQSYRQLEVQKSELKATHVLTFLLVTLVILLATTWMGLYLARRMTTPIQALAEGARRVGRGELEHRVEVSAGDELGVLVDDFNAMTRDLQLNKELLERSNLELGDSNRRLVEERALLAAVLENVAAGVVTVDTLGRVLLCNEAALSMLRQRAEEVVDRPISEAWSDPERTKLAALLAPESPAPATRELHLVLGGTWKTFEVKITPMPSHAGGGRVLVLEDLTELIQAQQLATWNEAARRVAHEIKNPLTPIRLAAERLLRRHQQGDPQLGKTLEDSLAIIIREVGTMKTLVDEFSQFARMRRPQPVPVDLAELVSEIVHLYRDIKPGVEVREKLSPHLDPIHVDRELFRSVFINLLDNAIEATEAPGEIEVRAARAEGRVRIDVADSGRGIRAEDRDKLFLPYFSTKGRGTGLGLAIVHRIVNDHHGSIHVADNRPTGTVFTIELPAD